MDRHKLWKSMDNYKRKFFLKNEFKKKILKSFVKSKCISQEKRYRAAFYLSTLPRISSITILRNRCVISGRVWSVNSKTRYSRFILRSESYKSNIPGLKRASW